MAHGQDHRLREFTGGSRVACVVNPGSGMRRRDAADIRSRLLNLTGKHNYYETTGIHELDSLFDQPGIRTCSLLLVSGGDGTVQATLSALLRSTAADNLPVVALLPSGSTNISVADLYGKTSIKRALLHLNIWLSRPFQDWHVLKRSMMRVQRSSLPQSSGHIDQYGFIFGTGSIVRGIEYCHEEVYRRGLCKNEWASAMAMLRVLYGLYRQEKIFSESTPMCVRTDTAFREVNRTFVLATTLDRLFLGVRPFWGDTAGDFHFTEVLAQPRKLLRSLPFVLLGKPTASLLASGDYRSGKTNRAQIEFSGRFTLDGEIMDNVGPMTLSAGPPIRFLHMGRV